MKKQNFFLLGKLGKLIVPLFVKAIKSDEIIIELVKAESTYYIMKKNTPVTPSILTFCIVKH